MTLKRNGEIRLHTDQDGQVWFKERGREPREAGLSPEDLVGQSWLLDAERVMLLAHRENAELVTALHSVRCVGGRPQSVWLGNPRLCPKEYNRISTIFGRMDGWDTAPSIGGWRELTEKDYVTYALASVLKKSKGRCSNLAERLLRAHPSWPAMSFISDLNTERACELICTMLDPRWHVDPAKPDARKRMNSLFGLGRDGMKNLEFILTDGRKSSPPGRNTENARLVLDTWTGNQNGDGYVPPIPEKLDAHGFLWRLANKKPTGVRGILRACHVFLAFVKDVWLDNLTPHRVYEPVTRKLGFKKQSTVNYLRLAKCGHYSPQLFVPEHFFELSTEVSAWKRHIDRLKQRAF